jgi:hypothetical protein
MPSPPDSAARKSPPIKLFNPIVYETQTVQAELFAGEKERTSFSRNNRENVSTLISQMSPCLVALLPLLAFPAIDSFLAREADS